MVSFGDIVAYDGDLECNHWISRQTFVLSRALRWQLMDRCDERSTIIDIFCSLMRHAIPHNSTKELLVPLLLATMSTYINARNSPSERYFRWMDRLWKSQ